MPPKKSASKKSKDDNFDLLLAEAAKVADQKAAKNAPKKEAAKKEGKEDEVAEAAPKVVSTADHPENPYPQPTKEGNPRQTWPEPTIPVSQQFKGTTFPKGIISRHPGEINNYRESSEEKRAAERMQEGRYDDLRHAAEVHRQVRTYANSIIRPGVTLMSIADKIEKKLEELIGKDGLKRGQAFPTGVSLNHVAAHYTPNTDSAKVVLNYDDVLKVDFGTHINGRIVDSAWTVAFDNKYDPLLEAVREATYEGIKQAGIDVRVHDIGAAIQEVMESYEIELNGKTHKVRSIRNLNGHNIGHYVIHGGKYVPIIGNPDVPNDKMEEGDLFAIETFGSTGKGVVIEDGECSHYMPDPDMMKNPNLRNDKAKALLKHIEKTYNTLPFCRKWLDRQGQDKHLMALNALCDAGVVHRCPPLVDVKGCYTAQFEHTFILKPTGKEVLSKGDDY